jgi:hypothetical protein
MHRPTLTLAETAQANLRLAAAAVEKRFSDAITSEEPSRALETLRDSWRSFLVLLALDPEPERRDCPFCRGPMRLNATRCVHCWKQSSPPG